MKFDSPQRKKFEYIVVILVILIVGLLVGANIYYQTQEAKQKALFYQLQIIRSSVSLFKIAERRNPTNLAELSVATYTLPGNTETKRYLPNVPMDKSGNLLDPFGNSYIYDFQTAWVRSSTKGYEMW